jgi:hypothetical protein
MTEFFNRKEEVIDLQLTQHGKRLLSRGTLKPVYYTFHDDDVLYDSRYGGFDEVQNDIHGRIKDALRPKAQYVYTGVETNIKKATNVGAEVFSEGSYKNEFIASGEKLNVLPQCLGASDPNTRNAPAWNISLYRAPISSSSPGYSGSIGGTVAIPQLEVVHQINTYVGVDAGQFDFSQDYEFQEVFSALAEQELVAQKLGQPVELFQLAPTFDDGTFLYEEQSYVFVDARENNTTFMKENFDVEVFRIDYEPDLTTGLTASMIRQLKFLSSGHLDDQTLYGEDKLGTAFSPPTPDDVEYYFDLNVDNEIDPRILCQINFDNNKVNLFADSSLEFDCLPYKFLDQPVVDPETVEDCE